MDIRAYLQRVAPVSGRQFAWFRIAFGAYLAIHFAHLIPWGAELFSHAGVIPDAGLNPTYGILPNVLARWDTPGAVTSFLLVMVGSSIAFAIGVARRPAAVVLWYGWACLFNRNVLISNPSLAYVGLLLLLTVLIPTAEPYRAFARKDERPFYFPAAVFHTAWILMAVGYSFSGAVKFLSPSWVDGTAFWHVVNNPLARDWWLRDVFLLLPMPAFAALTWGALALETLFLPLSLWQRTRPVAWASMVAMHVGIITLVSFADLSAGMLTLHLFTFDPQWLEMRYTIRARLAAWRAPRLAADSAGD